MWSWNEVPFSPKRFRLNYDKHGGVKEPPFMSVTRLSLCFPSYVGNVAASRLSQFLDINLVTSNDINARKYTIEFCQTDFPSVPA